MPIEIDSLFAIADTVQKSTQSLDSKFDWWTVLVDAVLPLVAVFLGAFLAFWLERRHKEHETREKRQVTLALAQFALITQTSFIVNIVPTLEEHLDNPKREWHFPIIASSLKVIRADIQGLAFLLSSKGTENEDDANLVNRIYYAEQQYETFREILEARNESYTQFQKRLSAIGYDGSTPLDVETVGRALDGNLRVYTETLYRDYKSIIRELISVRNELECLARRRSFTLPVIEYKEEVKALIDAHPEFSV